MSDSAEAAPLQLSLPGFEGTLDELLVQVGRRHVEVESISASTVTASVIRYLDHRDELDLDVAGELLVAAARLLTLKSGRLLLQQEPEEDVTVDVDTRTGDREAVRAAVPHLREREATESFPLAGRGDSVERIQAPRSPAVLANLWRDMEGRRDAAPTPVAVPAFVRLESAVSRLIRRLRSGGTLRLKRLLRGANRNDAVVGFLAVLELIRTHGAHAVQDEPFGEIVVQIAAEDVPSASRAG